MSLDRLYATIPSLTAKERETLREKEMEEDGQNPTRAFSSREFARQQARVDIAGLLKALRATGELDWEKQTRGWLEFAGTLIDDNAAQYLADLVGQGVIPHDAIPAEWSWMEGGTVTLREAIRTARASLARDVLYCVLPRALNLPTPD